MWPLTNESCRIMLLHEQGLLLVRIVGAFDGAIVRDKLFDLTRDNPRSAAYRTIFDFRYAEGILKEEDSASVRDFRYQTRVSMGIEGLSDGPHALIHFNKGGIEEIANTHAELHPDARICLTDSVEQAWQAVANDAPIPKKVLRFFSKT